MPCVIPGTVDRMANKVMGTTFVLFIFIGEAGNTCICTGKL